MIVQLGALEVERPSGRVLVGGQLASGGAFLQRRVVDAEMRGSFAGVEPAVSSRIGKQLGNAGSDGIGERVDRLGIERDRQGGQGGRSVGCGRHPRR